MDELKVIKDYFPKSYNKFVKIYGLVNSKNNNSSMQVSDIELDNYIGSHVKNLNLKVNYTKDTVVNAYTIPWDIHHTLDNRLFYTVPILRELYAINSVYLKLLRANIDATGDSNGIVTFTHNLPSSFILNTYQTSRMFSLLQSDVKARFAVTLHEIGHWHSVNPYIIKSLVIIFSTLSVNLTIISTFSTVYGIHNSDAENKSKLIIGTLSTAFVIALCILVIITFIIHYIGSINEEQCDAFVKKVGYGEDLSRSFFALDYGSNDFKELNRNKFLQLTSSFSAKISDFIHRIKYGYPTTDNRIAMGITEDISLLMFEIELKNLISTFDNFFG